LTPRSYSRSASGQTFFGTLRRKLNWAARPPERA
jgi:hypothetical protein